MAIWLRFLLGSLIRAAPSFVVVRKPCVSPRPLPEVVGLQAPPLPLFHFPFVFLCDLLDLVDCLVVFFYLHFSYVVFFVAHVNLAVDPSCLF